MKTKLVNKIILFLGMFFVLTSASFAQSVVIENDNTAVQGSPVAVEVDLQDLGLIGAISLEILYDPTVMSYVDFTNLNPSTFLIVLDNEITPGQVAISWFALAGNPDIVGTVPFVELNFDYIDCSSEVSFGPTTEIANDLGIVITGINYVDGSVSPLDPGPATTTWTGAVDQDWENAGNWDNGVPGCGSDVVIADAGANYAILNGGSKATAKVNSVTIQSMGALTVQGTLELSGDLTIEPNGSIIENGNVTVGGTTDFQIAGVGGTFQMVTPPVDYAQAFTFLGHFLRTWNETTQTWENVLAPSDILSAGTGYSLNAVSNEVFSFDAGSLISGDFSINGLTYSNGPNSLHDGFNLVGNPFASAVQFNSGNWTLNNVDPTAWVWDETFGNYRVSSTSLAGDIIPGAQGFFVRTLGTAGDVTIPQVDRVHGMTPLYKKSVDNQIKLLVEGNGYGDMIAVTLNDEATNSYDLGLDQYKLAGLEEAPQMYSIIDTEVRLSGNTLPYAPSVPFNLEVGADETYTITAEGMDSFNANTTIHLEDLMTGEMTNLKEVNTYSFSATTMDDPERFVLHFGTLGVDELSAQNIKVYAFSGKIHIQMPANTDGVAYVYNVMGQQVLTEVVNGNTQLSVESGSNYIVKVVSSNSVKTEKVFVK